MRERVPLLAGLTLLAVAILIGSLAIGSGIRNRNQNNVITVTGSAKQEITSDYAIWDFSVTSQANSAALAATSLAAWTGRTQAFLKARGIQPGELTIQPISTSTVTPDSNSGSSNKVVGYQLTRNFEVRSARVQAVAAIAEASSHLLAQGIPVSAQPLQYVYTKLGSIRANLLALAVRDAQQRGKVLLAATGSKLGGLRGVSVSPSRRPRPTRPRSVTTASTTPRR